nr:LOW QUALITY PROTEIN: integrin beta-PS-like [Lepeophtheirus salmonis]
MKFYRLILLILFYHTKRIHAICSNVYKTCGNCSIDPDCFWCLDPPGCMDIAQNCFNKYQTVNQVDILDENDPKVANQQQIYPKKVSMNLIPGQEEIIDFVVTQFKEYPVDLYFLVDLSWSMRGARDNIAIQGENIVRGIRKITKDLKVGFGSFIEKNVPPFTSVISQFNCPMGTTNCSNPYSFYHQMNLQKLSPNTFRERIQSAPLGGNVDEPEASFDALVQAMTCHKEIGWRKNSRKIILLTTDGDFHFALDGKLLGLLEPNDGQCHLNSLGYFTEEKVMDYPSISQIDAIARSGSYIVIFAVTSQYYDVYHHLSKQIKGSTVASLEKDATNIVEIVKELYEKVTTTVEVSLKNVKPRESNYTVKILANCNGEYEETKVCNNIDIDTPISFKAIVTLEECFTGTKTFQISVLGVPKSMTVELKSQCNCDCESHNGTLSKECGFNGVFQCGTCYCHGGFMGESCECESNFTVEEQNEACLDPNSSKEEESKICSSRGKCICGECECSKSFYGTYCQCDDLSCPMNVEGEICSNNGKCVCNQCKCESKWEGLNCGCSKENSFCVSPFNGKECSGNGNCECNEKCSCREEFGGKFCQILPQTSDSCSLLKECMEKKLFEDNFEVELNKECSVFQIVYVTQNELKTRLEGDLCVLTRKDGCVYEFRTTLTKDTNSLIVYALEDKEERCRFYGVNYMLISLSTVIGTIVLGLLGILIYKLYIIHQDKREYERFLALKQNQKFALNENALYKNPISKFQNPTYLPSRPSN